jgi:hypothetical protein
VTALAIFAGATPARADSALTTIASEQVKQPAKDVKKEPKKEAKKEPKKEAKKEIVVVVRRIETAGPHGYWPGPVLPGMWGGVWGGIWQNSWWMGGPYLYSGWSGPWAGGSSYGGDGCCLNCDWCCGSGAHPWLLPPVFRPTAYPATSPYWVPRQSIHWSMPAAAKPAVVAANDGSTRPTRAVPAAASAEKLFADAMFLFFDGDVASAREHLAAAAKQAPRDARVWYFKALAERALGDESAARTSAANGAALEILGVTEKRALLTALERIQGTDRAFLSDLVTGPKAISVETARTIVAGLDAGKSTTVTSAK